MIKELRAKAKALKKEVYALSLALQDARVPWYAKGLAFIILAYAVSPVDLIPDFIPVLGLLDDIILIPLGIMLLLRFIPSEVMEDCRSKAQDLKTIPKPLLWFGIAFVASIWAILAYWIYIMAVNNYG